MAEKNLFSIYSSAGPVKQLTKLTQPYFSSHLNEHKIFALAGYTSKDYRECIRSNYTALLEDLPTDQLLAQLWQNQVITDNEKDEIQLIPLKKKKTTYLLDNVITHSLKADFPEKYLKMVEVMRNSGNPSAINLANRLL